MVHNSPEIFAVGVLGNIASFISFLAPMMTFYRVCKKKSTEGFQSVPYVAALFSAMLWIFYAYIKQGEILIITINTFGACIEIIYLAIYLTYCPKKARIFTIKLIVMFNMGGIFLVVLLTHVLAKERTARLELLGWICVVLSISVFAAPLSIMRVVVRTKSVEFMPFPLTVLLTISACLWMTYGILLGDIYVTLPNIVGITFGLIQMVLYAMYRKNRPVKEDQKLPEHKGDINSNNDNNDENVVQAVAAGGNGGNQQAAMDIESGEPKMKQDQTHNNDNKKAGEESSTQLQQHKEETN